MMKRVIFVRCLAVLSALWLAHCDLVGRTVPLNDGAESVDAGFTSRPDATFVTRDRGVSPDRAMPFDMRVTFDSKVKPDPTHGCGDFSMSVIDWSWSYESQNIYTINTLLQVDGPEACYLFADYYKYTRLQLIWNEGVTVDIYRTADIAFTVWHAGFGPRSCDGNTCEIGDIFQTSEVFQSFPLNADLNQLVIQYGVPDEACGHVYNADLIHKEYCAPLSPN